MAQNVGKKFEGNWKSSVPNDVFYFRIPDSPSSFNQGDTALRFSRKPPYDSLMYDGKSGTLFALELKSSGQKSFSFELVKGENKSANIHEHQIKNLTESGTYPGVIAGFIFNFRDDVKNLDVTYFQKIEDFNRMTNELRKKSFNIIDLIKYNPIRITSEKKKVNYKYDIDKFILDVTDKSN